MSFIIYQIVQDSTKLPNGAWSLKLECGHHVFVGASEKPPAQGKCSLCPVGSSSKLWEKKS